MKEGSNLIQVGLIICDIRMPNVNGIEVITFLKEDCPAKSILVITGYPGAERAVSLLQKGVQGYLVKPVEKEHLLVKVWEILTYGSGKINRGRSF